MQEDETKPQQSILDIFNDADTQNTNANQAPPMQQQTMQQNNTIFTSEIRQKHFNNILLRHEEISKRIDKRNKH